MLKAWLLESQHTPLEGPWVARTRSGASEHQRSFVGVTIKRIVDFWGPAYMETTVDNCGVTQLQPFEGT